MSTTVIECLENAKCNFETARSLPAIYPMAMEQLENAITALENGFAAGDIIQENAFGDVNTELKK